MAINTPKNLLSLCYPDDQLRCPYSEEVGKPRGEQYKEARYRMLGRQFSDYEAEIREHLGGMLSSKHFDFDRDVASLTVNRWAHTLDMRWRGRVIQPTIGRQPFGRIMIAQSDDQRLLPMLLKQCEWATEQ